MRRGAERKSNPELVPATLDRIGEHAVDAEACERQRNRRKRSRELHGEPLRRTRALDIGVKRAHVIDRQAWVERRDGRAHVSRERRWIAIGSDHVDHRVAQHESLGEKHLLGQVGDKAAQAEVRYYANDGGLACWRTLRSGVEKQML